MMRNLGSQIKPMEEIKTIEIRYEAKKKERFYKDFETIG